MNKLNLLSLMVLLMTALFMKPAFADEHMTLKEFFSLTYDQRVEACAKMVDSEDIGACATIKTSTDPSVVATTSQKEAAIISCIEEKGVSGTTDVIACAQTQLNAPKGLEMRGYTDKEFHNAVNYCIKEMHKSGTNDIASCARSKLAADLATKQGRLN